jgi:tripartite-type tricarboxylate transporter receptor subunit TctC
MKKALSLLLVCCLLLAGCGGSSNQPAPPPAASPGSPSEQGGSDLPTPPAGYPSKNINVIVPFSAGGGTDITARGFLKAAEKYIGVQFLVTNVEGSGGWAGWHQSLAQPHDGYNLSLMTINMFNDSGTENRYEDFVPLATLSRYPTTISVNAESDIFTIEDLIAKCKDNPGGLRFGVDGLGAFDHINVQKLEEMAGIKFSFVPYNGGAETMAALLGGNVDAITVSTPEVTVRGEDMRAIALMSDERHPKLPDTPTLEEKGYDIQGTRFRTMGAQKDVPEEILNYLEEIFAITAEDPEWLEYADSINADPYYLDRADSQVYLDEMAIVVRALS